MSRGQGCSRDEPLDRIPHPAPVRYAALGPELRPAHRPDRNWRMGGADSIWGAHQRSGDFWYRHPRLLEYRLPLDWREPSGAEPDGADETYLEIFRHPG